MCWGFVEFEDYGVVVDLVVVRGAPETLGMTGPNNVHRTQELGQSNCPGFLARLVCDKVRARQHIEETPRRKEATDRSDALVIFMI